MHLEEMKAEIDKFVVTKTSYNTKEEMPKKLLFEFIEFSEASEEWKKGDTSLLACQSVNIDKMFKKKLGRSLADNISMGKGRKENMPH